MASNSDAFLSALIGTTGLRPIQEVQQGQQQLAQGNQQLQIGQMQIAAAQQQQAKAAAFQQDTHNYFAHPTPANLAALVSKYPEQAEQLKKTYDILDAPARQSRVSQLGALYNAARNNRPELVSKALQSVIEAEKAQGIDTSDAEDALAAVRAGDPKALTYVQAFAQAHLAAADKDFAKALGIGEDFTLSQGQARFDSSGKQIAGLAPKPEYLVVPEGGKAVPINGAPALAGGGDQATVAPSGDIVARMIPITLGAEGGGSLANPKVSPKGARGPMQVMPGTNINPGFGVKPAQDDSESERARVGRDYLAAMVERYGDPAKAWAAYNAGPGAVDDAVSARGANWLQALPAETKRYVARNMSQLQRSGPTGSGVTVAQGDAPGTIYGNPKRGWTTLRPEEVPAGLDPSITYQRGPDGQIQPISGSKPQRQRMTPAEVKAEGLDPATVYYRDEQGVPQAVSGQKGGGAQFKPIPQGAVRGIQENIATVRQIDNAIAELGKHRNAIGPGTGLFGDWVTNNLTDPQGVTARAAIGKIAGQIIHDVSGAAVTLSEEPRFRPYVPTLQDSPETALAKLRQLRQLAQQTLAEQQDFYSEQNGYRPYRSNSTQSAPPRVRSIQEAQKLPPGTVFLTPDGQRRVRK